MKNLTVLLTLCLLPLSATFNALADDAALIDRVRDISEKAREDAKAIQLPKNHHPAAIAAANSAANYANSDEFKARVRKEKKRIAPLLDDHDAFLLGSEEEGDKEPNTILKPDERVLILLSKSVPKSTWQSYLDAVEKLHTDNVRIVMRGFVGGMKHVRPTMAFLQEMLSKEGPGCFQGPDDCEAYRATVDIDPLVFRKYHITAVPAFVYIKGFELEDSGKSIGMGNNLVASATSYVVQGDEALEGIFLRLYRATHDQRFEQMAKTMSGGFY